MRWMLALAGIGLSAASLALIAARVDVASAGSLLRRAEPSLIAAALGALALEVVVRALRWRTLIPNAASRPVRTTRLIPVMMIGYLGNALLPARLGEPARAALVSRREGVRFAESLASVVTERIVDAATLALLATGAALLVAAPSWAVRLMAAGALVGAVVLGGVMLANPRALIAHALRIRRHRPSARARRVLAQVELFGSAMAGRDRRQAIQTASAWSLLAWALDGVIFYALAAALGLDVGYAAAVFVSGVSVLSTVVPAAPGFVGTFELAGVSAGVAIGLSPDEGLALAVLAHVCTLGVLAGCGALALPFLRIAPG